MNLLVSREWKKCRSPLLFLNSATGTILEERFRGTLQTQSAYDSIVHAPFTWYQCVLIKTKSCISFTNARLWPASILKRFTRKKEVKDTAEKSNASELNFSHPFYLLSLRSKNKLKLWILLTNAPLSTANFLHFFSEEKKMFGNLT